MAENNLGVKMIELFSKDVDYDKQFFERDRIGKNHDTIIDENIVMQLSTNRKIRQKQLIKLWEKGGPVKLLRLPGLDSYPLYCKNFQNYRYEQMKKLFGNFYTIMEFENGFVRVSFRDEDDLRTCYKKLKKDKRYEVSIKVDEKSYCSMQDKIFSSDSNSNSPFGNNKISNKLIDLWLDKGDVICETSKPNIFPIQIYDYDNLNYDKLANLFSKYGNWISMMHLKNSYVRVKYNSEDAARNCVMDLRKNKNFNVKILFFLKTRNDKQQLVKNIPPNEVESHIRDLLAKEEKIKFVPNTSNRTVTKEYKKDKERNMKGGGVIIKDGHSYIEGTPLHNPYLIPPHSYLVWKSKFDLLPVPPPSIDDKKEEIDINYQYYLECMAKYNVERKLSEPIKN